MKRPPQAPKNNTFQDVKISALKEDLQKFLCSPDSKNFADVELNLEGEYMPAHKGINFPMFVK